MTNQQDRNRAVPTLATALQWLDGVELEPTEKRDLRSAVETACRWFRLPPDQVFADPVALRRLFKAVPAAAVGVSKKRRANVKWGIGRLLELAGIGPLAARRTPLSPPWSALIDALEDRRAQVLLRRFARFCCSCGVAPKEVSDKLASKFLVALEQQLRVAAPRTTHRQTVIYWNRNVTSNAAFPTQLLAVPSYRNWYVLTWSAFPPSLVQEIDSYLTMEATSDPFDLSKPARSLKASTISTYRDRLLRFASCLALAGADTARLRSLSDLVQIGAVEKGLRYLACERGKRPLAAAVATVLLKIAKHHLRRPKKDVDFIAEIAARLAGGRKNLSPRVRAKLAPLKHEGTLARLFLLPAALTRSLLRKATLTPKDAQLFQRALALALLTVAPLRIGSLCSVRMDRHFNWSGGAMKGDLIIEFAEGELKEDEPASYPIPRETANLIRTYWTRFRPLQDPRGSPFLFCGKDPERPRCKPAFSTALTRLTLDRLGLWVNPHLYRHIVHLVVLRKFPGAYAMVARVLSHRSIETTIRNYSHYDGEIAMRAYQHLVEDVKGSGPFEDVSELRAIAYGIDRESRNHAWG